MGAGRSRVEGTTTLTHAALEERLEEHREYPWQAAVRAEPHLPLPRDPQADLHAHVEDRRGADEGNEPGECLCTAHEAHRTA